MKKKNPRRKPASMADVKKAAQDGSDRGVRLAIAIFLMVLKDDFDFTTEQIILAWERMDKLSQEVAEKRITAKDLTDTLYSEYNIDLR